MSKLIAFLLCILPTVAFAQPGSTSGDRRLSLDVPFLTSGSPGRDPGTTISRFDKRILITSSGGSYTCLYLNTRNGDKAVSIDRDGSSCSEPLPVNDEKFALMLFTQSGDVLSFYNRKKNGRIEHYVTSGGTDLAPVSYLPDSGVLERRGETVDFFRHDYTAHPYRANAAGAPKFYLVGGRTPERLTVQKSLGYSGIGYLKTDRGIFMSFRVEKGETFFNVQSWESVTVDFDKAPFRLVEAELSTEFSEYYDREMRKLEAKRFSGSCSDSEQALNELRKQELRRQREAVGRTRSGNVYQNRTAVGGYSDLVDPSFQLESFDMDTQVKICKAEATLSRSSGERTRARLTEKIRCLNNLRLDIRRVKMEMDALDQRYRDNPERGLPEKQRLFGTLTGRACN